MDRRAIIAVLARHADEIRALGARSLYLFGSVLRDEATGKSDIDIYFDYDESSDFSLIELVRLQQYLTDLLGAKVDLMTRGSLHPLIREDVEAAAQRVL
jgi:uncharacterized protein